MTEATKRNQKSSPKIASNLETDFVPVLCEKRFLLGWTSKHLKAASVIVYIYTSVIVYTCIDLSIVQKIEKYIKNAYLKSDVSPESDFGIFNECFRFILVIPT